MAFTLAAGLTAGAVFDQDNVLRGGAIESILLFNFGDLFPDGTVTFDGSLVNMVTDIVLASGGKKAYKYEGFNRSMRPKYELVRGALSISYIHTIDFVVFQIDYATKMELTAMAMGKIVAIVQNLDTDDDNPYDVYGLDAGMELITNVRDINDADSNGAIVLQLATKPDCAREGHMPMTFFITILTTTTNAVEVLDTPTGA